MVKQGDIGVFNYPQNDSNFNVSLTTSPTVRRMRLLNKEAWRSQLLDCRLVKEEQEEVDFHLST